MKNMKKLFFGLIVMFTIAMIAPSILPKELGATEVQAAVTVGTPRLVSATASGKTAAVVRWKAVSGATGYRVYRRGAGESWKAVGNVGRSTLAIKNTGLTPGKLYAYTVRAYKRVGGKNYWSGYNRTGVRVVAARSYLKLNKTAAAIYVGKYYNLKLNGTSLKPTWRSSNTAVAVVNSAGRVTAKKAGTATITATLSGLRFTCKVTTKNYISMAASTVTVGVGQTKNVAINSSYDRLYMRSNNTSIASASWGNATTSHYLLKVKGAKVGTTTIIIQNHPTSPTMRKTINVKVVASATSVVNTNKNKVASYISTYGSTDSSGNRYIRYSQTIDGISYTWTVINQKSSYNRLYFQLSAKTDSYQTVTAMALPISSTTTASSAYAWVSTQVSAGFKASGKVTLSTFTENTSVPFTITESTGFDSATLNNEGKGAANEGLQNGFIGWDYLLKSKVGLSMSDIGFVRYV